MGITAPYPPSPYPPKGPYDRVAFVGLERLLAVFFSAFRFAGAVEDGDRKIGVHSFGKELCRGFCRTPIAYKGLR